MKKFRYLNNVATLKTDIEKCIGCGNCQIVCPHRVLEIKEKKVAVKDIDACIECGACVNNCPTEAISVNAGVGCASYIISQWTGGKTGGCC